METDNRKNSDENIIHLCSDGNTAINVGSRTLPRNPTRFCDLSAQKCSQELGPFLTP